MNVYAGGGVRAWVSDISRTHRPRLICAFLCFQTADSHVWEKSGSAVDVNASPRLRLDPDGTLHISQTWSGDIGTYTCRVTSVGGNDSRSAHLRVRSAPFPFLSRIYAMSDGSSSSSAPPPPSVLLFTPVCAYRQLPHAPENPIAVLSAAEKRAINLTWAQAFDGNSPLIRYILEVSENSECPAPRCISVVKHGRGPFSFHLRITSPERIAQRNSVNTGASRLHKIPPKIGIIYPWEQMLIHVSLEQKRHQPQRGINVIMQMKSVCCVLVVCLFDECISV